MLAAFMREKPEQTFRAPSIVRANTMVSSQKLRLKSETYFTLCFMSLERAQDKVNQSKSLRKLQPIMLKNMLSLNRFIQLCLVGGFTGWRPNFIICLALPLIIH